MAQIPQGIPTQRNPPPNMPPNLQNPPAQKNNFRKLMQLKLLQIRNNLAESRENIRQRWEQRREQRKQNNEQKRSDKAQNRQMSDAIQSSSSSYDETKLGGFLRIGGALMWILDVFMFVAGFMQKLNSYYYLHLAFAMAAYFSFPRNKRRDYIFPISLLLIFYIFLPTAQHYFDLYLTRIFVSSGNAILDFMIYLLLTPVPFPYWFMFGLSFRRDTKTFSSVLYKILIFCFVIFFVMGFTWSVVASEASADAIQKGLGRNTGTGVSSSKVTSAGRNAWEATKTVARDAIQKITEAPKQLQLEKEKALEYATGGYYQGQVEEKAEEELGVFIENIKSPQTSFFDDESGIVWATLRARTLSDETPMKVSLKCTIGEKDTDKFKEGEIIPSAYSSIDVSGYEQYDIGCEISKEKIKLLGPGVHPVQFTAVFNFPTQAYLKTYFMDNNVKRSLQRENIDVFRHYGITDTYPIARFTNGPIKIGAETTNNLPIGITKSKDSRVIPRLGITIENQWNGKIKKIKSVNIMTPEGIKLSNCPVIQPPLPEDKDGVKYNDYSLNLNDGSLQEHTEDIDKYFSINCIMDEIDYSLVLGTDSVATRYILIDVNYDYVLDKSFNIEIKKSRSTEEEQAEQAIIEHDVESYPALLSDAELKANAISDLVSINNECLEGNKDNALNIIKATRYFDIANLRPLVDSAEMCSNEFAVGIKDRIIEFAEFIANNLERAKAKIPSFDESERSARKSDWKRVSTKSDTIIYSAIKSIETAKQKGININDEDISKIKNAHERIVKAQSE